MKSARLAVVLFVSSATAPALVAQSPLGSATVYQGRLSKLGAPVIDPADFQFRLYDAAAGGNMVASQIDLAAVAIRDGLFTVTLDFGAAAFSPGEERWLEIDVRSPTGSGDFVTLVPRQSFSAAPFAVFAQFTPFAGLTGVPGGGVWTLAGNAGTDDAAHFLGTTDTRALALRVQNRRVLRIEPAADSAIGFSPNVLAGHEENAAAAGVIGAAIGGGGFSADANPQPNRVNDYFGAIGGGAGNITGTDDGSPANASYGTIAGGRGSVASADYASVGGGLTNTADHATAVVAGGAFNYAANDGAAVLGGSSNVASGPYSSIGGGVNNKSTAQGAVAAGGESNQALGADIAVGGGLLNVAGGTNSVVAGGGSNSAGGFNAMVPGGDSNSAGGSYSFAAGRRAKALNSGAFVWADNTAADFSSTGTNQFLIRSSGGVGITTNAPEARLHVFTTQQFCIYADSSSTGGSWVNLRNTSTGGKTWSLISTGSSNGEGAGQLVIRQQTDGVVAIMCKNDGFVGIADIDPQFRLELPNTGSAAGRGRANAWSTYSSIRWKDNVRTIRGALSLVQRLRGVFFDWKPEYGGTPDVGFVAEEVGAVVPELVDYESNGRDAAGLKYDRITALAVQAIKEQQQLIDAQQRAIDRLRDEGAALRERLQSIERALALPETRSAP